MYCVGFLVFSSHLVLQRDRSTIIFKSAQAKLELKPRVVVTIMRSSTPIAIMLLFTLVSLSFGWAFAEESIAADKVGAPAVNGTVTNGTASNETLANNTLTNETLNNATLANESLENMSLTNESLENATLTNESLKNLTATQNETSFFGKVKGRQPNRR